MRRCAASTFLTSRSVPSRVNSGWTERLRRVLRGAFIGFGNVAAKGHLPGWQSVKDIQIVAATDAVAAQGGLFLEACPGGRWHNTVDELLSDKALDFVDICPPPSSHAALIKRALDARLHVLCEKPLVTRVEDAQ